MSPDRFIGIPFERGGYDYDDAHCHGLMWLWFRDYLGILLPRYDGVDAYDRREVQRQIASGKNGWPVVEAPEPNDVAVMRAVSGDRADSHLGVVMPRRRLLHTTSPQGSRVESLSSVVIASRIIEFRRYPAFC